MPTKKPPLLFIHGYRGSNDGLAEITAQFPNYDVHAPNIPPAGFAKFDSYDIKHYTDFIKNYIKKHDLKQPILIGHSLGSVIAAATAAKYPELVNDKLILLAPISKKPAKFFASLVPLTTLLPTRLVDYITTRYTFVPHNHQLFKKSLKITNNCAKSYNSKVEVMRAGKFSAAHSVPEFNFDKNTLIVVGEKDRLIPFKETKKYAEKIGAKLIPIKNSGHIINYEHPQKVADSIKSFI